MKRRTDDERMYLPESLSGDGMLGSQPPSIPMDSSERGAEAAKKFAPSQRDGIVIALRAAGCIPNSGKYLSREDLMERVGMSEKAACGRLGPSGPLLLPKGEADGHWEVRAVEDACIASSGLRVLGYQLTKYGVDRADILTNRRAA